jgi:hypothetical protein
MGVVMSRRIVVAAATDRGVIGTFMCTLVTLNDNKDYVGRKCNILSCWTLPIPDKKEKISVKPSQFNKN